MIRRNFLTLLGGASAWPLAARAQRAERMRRIGVLMTLAPDDPEAQQRAKVFETGLQELGWIHGRNLEIAYRWAPPGANLRTQAAELVAAQPELILSHTTPALRVLQEETRTIPIVFVQVIDPIDQGFVASLARPGGNITGFTNFEPAMGSKWLEMLKEIAPGVARVALMFNPDTAPFARMFWQPVEDAAPFFDVEPMQAHIRDVREIEHAIEAFARNGSGGLMVLPDITTTNHRDLIIALAARHRMPAVYPYRYFAVNGGLVSYGNEPTDMIRQATTYVDRILKGAKPADLPVQLPTKYTLVVNLKTTTTLGLTIPESFLQRADEVIE
jgi:putative tryptophan/tyrosine transport system substrate-binding protein